MNEIKSFPFFKNYYSIIKYLNDKDKLIIMNAILEFVFEDKEPNLEGLNLGIWENIGQPLKSTKASILNGMKGGRQKAKAKPKSKPKTKPKSKPKTKPNQISTFLFLFSNLYISNLDNKEYIYKLFKEYLEIRIKNNYILSETVVTRLINKLNEYGKTDKAKIEIIQKTINGGWKDFYPLKESEKLPEWFETKSESIKPTEEEQKELEELISSYE